MDFLKVLHIYLCKIEIEHLHWDNCSVNSFKSYFKSYSKIVYWMKLAWLTMIICQQRFLLNHYKQKQCQQDVFKELDWKVLPPNTARALSKQSGQMSIPLGQYKRTGVAKLLIYLHPQRGNWMPGGHLFSVPVTQHTN